MQLLQAFLEWGGTRRETARLVLSGLALLASILAGGRMPVDPAWVAIALCGVPILLEAVIGLVTAFDIKADVLVSIALAITGVLNPVMGALVHNAGSVLVILNSSLLLKWRGRMPRRKTV